MAQIFAMAAVEELIELRHASAQDEARIVGPAVVSIACSRGGL